MEPIGQANKYLRLALEDYGFDDFSEAIANEEQFGAGANIFQSIADAASKIDLQKIGKFWEDNQESITQVVGFAKSATESLGKGKKRVQQAESDFNNAQEPAGKTAAFIEGLKGEMQMMSAEMRRQLSLMGLIDADLQLEIVRNAFSKQYYEMPDNEENKLKRLALKGTIIRMDSKISQKFDARNRERVNKGLDPFIPSYSKPTIEYRS